MPAAPLRPWPLRPWIVGNWKMNGSRADVNEAQAIAQFAAMAPEVDVALCPPATLVAQFADAEPSLAIGGQDCHENVSGAFTGSISAAMLRDCGARLVIVGHSERREALSESNALVQAKAAAGLAAGLSVIICVGEPLAVREAGDAEHYVLGQIAESLADAFADQAASIAIAYEPIWAIGTGRVAEPADIAAMHDAIRAALIARFGAAGAAIRLLYGGSVNGGNAAAILALANVNGALVGGASLTAAAFTPIIAAARG